MFSDLVKILLTVKMGNRNMLYVFCFFVSLTGRNGIFRVVCTHEVCTVGMEFVHVRQVLNYTCNSWSSFWKMHLRREWQRNILWSWRDGSVIKNIFALTEDLSSVRNTHIRWFIAICNSNSRASQAVFWPLGTHMHVASQTHTYIHKNIHT